MTLIHHQIPHTQKPKHPTQPWENEISTNLNKKPSHKQTSKNNRTMNPSKIKQTFRNIMLTSFISWYPVNFDSYFTLHHGKYLQGGKTRGEKNLTGHKKLKKKICQSLNTKEWAGGDKKNLSKRMMKIFCITLNCYNKKLLHLIFIYLITFKRSGKITPLTSYITAKIPRISLLFIINQKKLNLKKNFKLPHFLSSI